MPTDVARRRAARSSPNEVGMIRYRQKKSPEVVKVLENLRGNCLAQKESCWTADLPLYKREKQKPGAKEHKLPAEEVALVSEVCKDTHDCGELWMMLDKNGYEGADLVPVAKSFSDSLTEGCVAGECTCGEAARYLASDDPKSLELAIYGCQNGEAEGCYELGRHFEEGHGLPKDMARAEALYTLACPPTKPLEFGPGPRLGEYSPRACDRLADWASAGEYPPKNKWLAMYYGQFACPHAGYQVDHGACVRLARFVVSNTVATGHNGSDAWAYAAGSDTDGIDDGDCTRPSVREACAAFKKQVPFAK